MFQADINFWAVLAAAVVNMVTGALWYSKFLFAKPWMLAVGKTEDELKTGAGTGYAVATLMAMIAAYVLAHFVHYTGATEVVSGAQTGFWAWLGFVVPTHAVDYMFSGRSKKLMAIQVGYHLVSLVLMGALLASWQ